MRAWLVKSDPESTASIGENPLGHGIAHVLEYGLGKQTVAGSTSLAPPQSLSKRTDIALQRWRFATVMGPVTIGYESVRIPSGHEHRPVTGFGAVHVPFSR
jgi:hypothetical protein